MEFVRTPNTAYKLNTTNNLAGIIALIVHISGAIGILFFKKDWFLGLTPLNLLLVFILLIWTTPIRNRSFYWFVTIAILLGFVTEMIGVNTGFLFGSYQYGEILGQKIFGVPILISFNWFMIVYASGICVNRYLKTNNIFIQAFLGAFLATLFDWTMEPAAIKLGFWKWENNTIPLFNYITWFGISALLLLFFNKKKFEYHPFALYLLIIQAAFFLVLRG
jgi:putative membrane protein